MSLNCVDSMKKSKQRIQSPFPRRLLILACGLLSIATSMSPVFGAEERALTEPVPAGNAPASATINGPDNVDGSIAPANDRKKILLASSEPASAAVLSPHAQEAARLMGIEADVRRLLDLKSHGGLGSYDPEALKLQLQLVRKIMATGLQLRVVSAQFDGEITLEQQALDRVTRERDYAVAMLNNANFLQLGILSIIIDGPLEETTNQTRILNGNRLNIVSGIAVGGLALLSLCAQRGGVRHGKSEANLLGQTLGLATPDSVHLPPVLWSYLNAVPPDNSSGGLTRREQLIKYWETTRVLPVNIKKEATKERLSGFGEKHHKWCESIKLMTARVSMLFDLRAMVDRLNTGLVELLQAVD